MNEVESTSDVFDDFGLWVERLHIGDLSGQVVSLLCTREETITNSGASNTCSQIGFDIKKLCPALLRIEGMLPLSAYFLLHVFM